MRIDRADPGFEKIATFDIETTHYKPREGEIVSIGAGVHKKVMPIADANYVTFHRSDNTSEVDVAANAFEWLDNADADLLVTFNGRDFDFDFIDNRMKLLNENLERPNIDSPETHLDLLADYRKKEADRRNEKWPSLEEVLDAYNHEYHEQTWDGKPLDNTRFGEELGPAYLNAVEKGSAEADELREIINEYLRDDLKKNLQIYYYDINRNPDD